MEMYDDDLDNLANTGYKVTACEDVKNGLLCPFCKLLMRNPVQTCRGGISLLSLLQASKKRQHRVSD